MSSITPRVPMIDWSKGFDRHWCGNSATMTHWYNAMSFLFPYAEQFFRDTVREVVKGMDLSGHPELQQAVRDFVAQESIHSAQHERYNEVLVSQGYENVALKSILFWRSVGERYLSPLSRLAIVCTYEHYTAVLAENLLGTPKRWMAKSPDMALVWGWHAAEEAEHKAVCFDLYKLAGGGWLRRVIAFFVASTGLNTVFFGRQFLYMMRKDRAMRDKAAAATTPQNNAAAPTETPPVTSPAAGGPTLATTISSTLGSSAERRALLGPVGFDVRAALSYLKPSFHPWQRDNSAQVETWLKANASRLRIVGKAAPAADAAAHTQQGAPATTAELV